MTAIDRVLATTDLSAPARHAAERAARLAAEIGARLDLIHVIGRTPLDKLRRLVTPQGLEVEQRVVEAASAEVEELAETLRLHHGLSAGVQVMSGSLLVEIAAQADALDAGLLVLGARGASFMRHALLGSTAERMVSRATRPMLVVKQAAHESYRSLLIPVDFSPSSLRALQLARAVAPRARIVLLHAFEVPFEGKLQFAGVEEGTIHGYRIAARQEAVRQMHALREAAGLAPHEVLFKVLHGDATQRILEQEQEEDCDLIVMGKHGENLLEDLLLGSVTRHVLSQSQGDVLVSV
ncbi:MAG: universal stress protein [Betaproteobacteria bacterium]|nr:MAG: universal stress protein [Betaproteobacteria bacterium]